MPTSPINDTAPRIQYEAAASQTDFTFPFWVTAENDLAVYVGSAKKELSTDYTVSGVLNTNGGTVSFNAGLSAGEIVTIERAMPFARVSEFQEAGTFKASVLNLELSKLIAMMQQIKGDIGRKMGLSPTSQVSDANLVLPDPVDGKALVFNGSTGAMRTSVVNVDDIDSAVTNAQNAATTATSARDTALQAETDAQSAQTAAETARDEAVTASGKVFASGTDTTSGTLDEKLLAGNGLLKSTLGGGADEDIQLAADYPTKATAEAGTNNTKVMTPLRTKQAIDAHVALQEFYQSSTGGSVAGSATNTFAHGLSAEPTLVIVYAKALVANNGFALGETYILGQQGMAISATHYGFSITTDSTNVVVEFATNGTQGIAKNDHALFNLSNTQWELHVRAWV